MLINLEKFDFFLYWKTLNSRSFYLFLRRPYAVKDIFCEFTSERADFYAFDLRRHETEILPQRFFKHQVINDSLLWSCFFSKSLLFLDLKAKNLKHALVADVSELFTERSEV